MQVKTYIILRLFRFNYLRSTFLDLLSLLLSFLSEIADFFFVDTTPFVNKYWTDPEDHHYDWREVSPRETYIENLSKVRKRCVIDRKFELSSITLGVFMICA